MLLVPAKVGGRGYVKVMQAGLGMVTGTMTKLLGTQLLTEVQTFVSAMDTMFGGLRERADATAKLLRAPGTAFVVVAAPEPDALREASYFVERLVEEDMPLAGVVVNRVHHSLVADLSVDRALAAAEALEDDPDVPSAEAALAAGVLRTHAQRMEVQASEQRKLAGFALAHPKVRTAVVPAFAEDVHDLGGLRELAAALCAQERYQPDSRPWGQPTAE
jgi:anion-transporting  ArsA/GET3 family ATPase